MLVRSDILSLLTSINLRMTRCASRKVGYLPVAFKISPVIGLSSLLRKRMISSLSTTKPAKWTWRIFLPYIELFMQGTGKQCKDKSLEELGAACWPCAAPPSPRSATDRLACGSVCAPCAAPPRAPCATFLLAFRAVRAPCAAPPRALFATFLLSSSLSRACNARQNSIPSSRSQV